VVIWKDPVTQMQRTKALGLLHKTVRENAAMSRMGLPDYLITMRAPGDAPERVKHDPAQFPVSRWQKVASPVWMDIDPSDTLQYRSAREDEDERHICPLQLEVIRRGVDLWTNPGETGGGKETNGLDDDGNGYVDDWRGWDFANNDNDPSDGHSHGSHVAGTIAAVGNNANGVVGVNWNAKIMVLKVMTDGGSGNSSWASSAISYAAAKGARVINMSFGGGWVWIDPAYNAGVVCVAAAGNDGAGAISAPASQPHVISVAATDESDNRAGFSNYGPGLDIGAPGTNTYSTMNNYGYGYKP
jgi:subtilisin family serine protease